MLKRGSKSFKAAVKALEAMHEFWMQQPQRRAVQWIEDEDGRVVLFTRGEYRDKIMRAIGSLSEVEFFELQRKDKRGDA